MKKPLAILLSDSETRFTSLRKALEEIDVFEIVSTQAKFVQALLVGNPHQYAAFVYDCDVLDEVGLDRVLKIADRMEQGKILVLASQISVFAYRQAARMSNIVTLQKPYAPAVFEAMIRKIAAEQDLDLSRFPRFITDEPVRMVVLKTGLLIPTRMKNYSAGGAFLEYRGISLKVGDTIQLNLGNRESMKAADGFQLKARVAWIKEGDGPRSPMRGVGIQFLDV